jgi:hypothetical protein
MMSKLEQFEERFEDAKSRYLEIMKGENDAAILFKWIAENDINEWGIFHNGAHGCESLEGWVSMYHHLHHALYDDGDVTFVNTAWQGPKIVFYWKNEKNFEEVFYKSVGKHLKKSFTISGYFNNVQEFIAEYERHEIEREEQYEKLANMKNRIGD